MTNKLFEPNQDILNFHFNCSKEAFMVFDLEGHLLHLNQALVQMLGVVNPHDLKALSLFNDYQLGVDKVSTIKNQPYSTFSYGLDLTRLSSDHNIKINEPRLIQLTMDVSLLSQQYYYIAVSENIKSFELNVPLQNEQLNLAMDAENLATWEWNLTLNTMKLSQNVFRWFDFDIHYLSSDATKIFNLVHPEDVNYLKGEVDQFAKGASSEFTSEFRIRQNEMDYNWVRMDANLHVDDESQETILKGILVNITTQKLDQLELESERNQINDLFNNMNTGFALHRLITDDENNPVDFEYIYVNPAFGKMTGLDTAEIVGRKGLDLQPDFDSDWLDTFAKAALEGETVRMVKYIQPLKKYFDMVVYQSDPGYFAVIFTDVTEKKRAEKALVHADKMNSIGQLAGGIAHDFNNHLQIIRGYSEILDEKLKNSGNYELRDYIEQIQDSVRHSSDMIKQLLAFSKDDKFIGKPMDFHYLLHQTKGILSHTLNRNVPIQLMLEARDYQIIGDESLLQNAVINLCLNSRDALPNGGLIMVMTKNINFHKDTYVGMTKLKAGNYLICSVRDNGDGIDSEDLDHIFEPFFTTKANKGTGMGLAAVFGTIKNHNGAIDINSVKGEWTQIDLYLPISTESVQYTFSSRKEALDTFNPYSILLVDDEPVITMVIQEFLEELGHKVTVYNSPNALLEDYYSISSDIDLVLLDVIMPEMDGFNLLEELVQLDSSIKVIFLSGYFSPDDTKEHLKPHILDYIEKPVDLTKLDDKIQRLMLKEQ